MSMDVLRGIAQGIDKATMNLYNISTQKQKMKQERERFDLDKKLTNLQLKKLEYETTPEMFEMMRQEKQAELKAKESNFNLVNLQMRNAEIDQKQKMQKMVAAGLDVAKNIPGITPEEIRTGAIKSYSKQTAMIGGQEVEIAPPDFITRQMSVDSGKAKPEDAFAEPFAKTLKRNIVASSEEVPETKVVGNKLVQFNPQTRAWEDTGIQGGKVNPVTQKALKGIASYKTREEALSNIDKYEGNMQTAGVDIDYLREQALNLPSGSGAGEGAGWKNNFLNALKTGQQFFNPAGTALAATAKLGAAQDKGQAQEFNSIEEAEAAFLPAGTKIIVNGRRAIIQ